MAVLRRGRRGGAVHTTSGLRPPPHPPEGAAKIEILFHYLDHYEMDFGRARLVVKSRSSNVVVAVASANAAIAVFGALTAVSGLAALGVASTAFAGFVGIVTAWDSHFRHRELWVQRTLILSDVQALRRTMEMRRAGGENPDSLADEGMARLNAILEADMASWSEVRRLQQPPADKDVPLSGSKNAPNLPEI